MLTLLYEIKLNGDVFNPCYEVRILSPFNGSLAFNSRTLSKRSIQNPSGADSRLTEDFIKQMVESLSDGIAFNLKFNYKIKDFTIVKYSKEVCLVAVTYPEIAKIE